VSVEAIRVKTGLLKLANQGGDTQSGAYGADFLVVGRSITESPDPARALAEILGV
jgi:orotidine-5'-phosphate decarboxylase